MMHRLFVGLPLPEPVADALIGLMGGVAGARWQSREQLHLTLRFIGEVDRHTAADVVAALGRVALAPFAVHLATPGSFDRKGRLDQLWSGVGPKPPLAELAHRINQALQAAGVASESRAFVPHITLARFGRTSGSLAGWPAQPLPALAWKVDRFVLWESQLGHGGSVYAPVAHYPGAERFG
jgi:2'-5' RNA ligase